MRAVQSAMAARLNGIFLLSTRAGEQRDACRSQSEVVIEPGHFANDSFRWLILNNKMAVVDFDLRMQHFPISKPIGSEFNIYIDLISEC